MQRCRTAGNRKNLEKVAHLVRSSKSFDLIANGFLRLLRLGPRRSGFFGIGSRAVLLLQTFAENLEHGGSQSRWHQSKFE